MLHLDIPNMLFNIALKGGWFPGLTLLTDQSAPLLSPQRFPIDEIAATHGSVLTKVENRRQQLDWYRNRIRPAVLEWSVKALEHQIGNPDNQLRERPLEQAEAQQSGGSIDVGAVQQLSTATASPGKPNANADRRKRKAERIKREWPAKYVSVRRTPLPNCCSARHIGRMPDSTAEEKPAASARDQWRERIAEQARSSVSIKQFCKDRGIPEHAFYAWRRRLRETEPVRFALVDRAGGPHVSEWNLELTLLNGERLRIGAGVDTVTLRAVLEALRA